MKRSARLLGALLVVFVALPVSAHNPEYAPNYSRPGLYLSGGGYFALVSSSEGFAGADMLSWNPDPSLDFRLGWRENERLALELDFGWIPSTDGIEYGN